MLETALRAGGYSAGKAWDGQVAVPMIPPGEVGAVTAGTGEFEGLAGNYTEAWTVAARRRGRPVERHRRDQHDHESAAMKIPIRRASSVCCSAQPPRAPCCTSTRCREQSAAQPNATDRVLHYSLPDQVLEFAVGEDARLFGQDTGDDSLWEETIDRTAVLGLVLNDAANQPAAIASRLMATSADTDLLLRGVLLSDHWLVTIPSEGTLFVRAESNAWPFLEETLVPGLVLSTGRGTAPPNIGRRSAPARTTVASSLGVTGTFRGSEGSVVEHYEISALDPAARARARERASCI